MRRLGAAGIDFIISYVLSVITYCSMVSIWKLFKVVRRAEVGTYFPLMGLLLFFVAFILSNMAYSIFFDSVFQGRTPGKKIVRYDICLKEGAKNRNWIIKHAVLKTVASMLYAITALYYIATYRMPYDKICRTGIKKEVNLKPMKEKNCQKRLVAAIIDYFVMVILYVFIMFVIVLCLRNQIEIIFNLFGMFMWLSFICIFSYSFVMDYFCQGSSIGKKVVGIRLVADKRKINGVLALKHSVLKLLACFIWPISLIYYLTKNVMFYDKWMKLEMMEEERNI